MLRARRAAGGVTPQWICVGVSKHPQIGSGDVNVGPIHCLSGGEGGYCKACKDSIEIWESP